MPWKEWPKSAETNKISYTVARHAPSMWQVAPVGITTEEISLGTPSSSQDSSCKGMAAAELLVPNAVNAGRKITRKKFFTPQGPAARKA